MVFFLLMKLNAEIEPMVRFGPETVFLRTIIIDGAGILPTEKLLDTAR